MIKVINIMETCETKLKNSRTIQKTFAVPNGFRWIIESYQTLKLFKPWPMNRKMQKG